MLGLWGHKPWLTLLGLWGHNPGLTLRQSRRLPTIAQTIRVADTYLQMSDVVSPLMPAVVSPQPLTENASSLNFIFITICYF